ncbi:MAG: hypothetical protein NT016_01145 [Candidatus Aenigmarchaeota archaeon]|nr:hypothetical protein [Candidatus Aenigmarchaeota archaeon]
MTMHALGNMAYKLFDPTGYREERAVKANALNTRMAEAIGSAKTIPGYNAAKEVRELDTVADEHAHERIGEIAYAIKDKADPLTKALGLVDSPSNFPGVAEALYLKEREGKGLPVEPLTVEGLDYNGTRAFLNATEPGWNAAAPAAYGPLQRLRDLALGLGSGIYGANLTSRAFDGMESHRGLSTLGKVAAIAVPLVVGGIVLKNHLDEAERNSPENLFIKAALAQGVDEAEGHRIYGIMKNAATNDPQITADRDAVAADTAKYVLDNGYAGMHLKPAAFWGIGNATAVARMQHGLAVDDAAVRMLVDAIQVSPYTFDPTNPDIYNPTPTVLVKPRMAGIGDVSSSPSSSVIIGDPAAVHAWAVADQLKAITGSGFDVVKHPEMFYGLNEKIKIEAWCANHFWEARPDSPDLKELMMLSFELDPARERPEVYNPDFPKYDSAKLKEIYNTPERVEALKAAMVARFTMTLGGYQIGYDYVPGLKGCMLGMRQAYDMVKNYPDGETYGRDPRIGYYDDLGDLSQHGYADVISHILNPAVVAALERHMNSGEWAELAKDNDGIDGYLNDNWKYWDLAKFSIGYGRIGIGDDESASHTSIAALRMANIPVFTVHNHPQVGATSGEKYAICLPPDVADKVDVKFPGIAWTPGYGVGPYNSNENLLKKIGVNDSYIIFHDAYRNPPYVSLPIITNDG